MKQQEDAAPAWTGAPRYRYWTEPPTEITVQTALLERLLPEAARGGAFATATVALPAAEVLATNVPRLTVNRLAELFPDNVKPTTGAVTFPAHVLATAYFLVQKSEELQPVAEVAAIEEIPAVAEEVVPLGETIAAAPEPVPAAPAEPAPISIPPPPMPKVRLPKPPVAAIPVEEPPPLIAPPEPPPAIVPPPPGAPAAEIQLPSGNAAAEQLSAARRSGFLRGIPLFRRKPPETTPPPPPAGRAEPKTEVILPPPEPPTDFPKASIVLPSVSGGTPPPEAMAEIEPPPASLTKKIPLPPPKPLTQRIAGDPVLVTETLPTPDPQIEDQEPLQALFLTEEPLTVPRVVELCCTLPGITSCVLARGASVIAAHNVPVHVDIVSLSANATEMLRAMRESSARMGVGDVPAVTLHTEKGVISFFHSGELALLVFHKDRGFVPGVREKMATALGELSKARLALNPPARG